MADIEAMKTIFSKQNRTLYLLMGLFLLPVIAAHYVFQHASYLTSDKGTNYGSFVSKPIVWQTGTSPRPWQLVLKVEDYCQQDCLAHLDKLSRLRLSMGRKLYDLDLVLLLPSSQKLLPKLKAQLKNQNILWSFLGNDEASKWAPEVKGDIIILFGPAHQAVLKYPKVFESKRLAHDLQLLIK